MVPSGRALTVSRPKSVALTCLLQGSSAVVASWASIAVRCRSVVVETGVSVTRALVGAQAVSVSASPTQPAPFRRAATSDSIPKPACMACFTWTPPEHSSKAANQRGAVGWKMCRGGARRAFWFLQSGVDSGSRSAARRDGACFESATPTRRSWSESRGRPRTAHPKCLRRRRTGWRACP